MKYQHPKIVLVVCIFVLITIYTNILYLSTMENIKGKLFQIRTKNAILHFKENIDLENLIPIKRKDYGSNKDNSQENLETTINAINDYYSNNTESVQSENTTVLNLLTKEYMKSESQIKSIEKLN